MDHYMKKTFYKTASLMANSCKAVAILGGGSRQTAATAWEYGRNLGLAFQVLLMVLCCPDATLDLHIVRAHHPHARVQAEAFTSGLHTPKCMCPVVIVCAIAA